MQSGILLIYLFSWHFVPYKGNKIVSIAFDIMGLLYLLSALSISITFVLAEDGASIEEASTIPEGKTDSESVSSSDDEPQEQGNNTEGVSKLLSQEAN